MGWEASRIKWGLGVTPSPNIEKGSIAVYFPAGTMATMVVLFFTTCVRSSL